MLTGAHTFVTVSASLLVVVSVSLPGAVVSSVLCLCVHMCGCLQAAAAEQDELQKQQDIVAEVAAAEAEVAACQLAVTEAAIIAEMQKEKLKDKRKRAAQRKKEKKREERLVAQAAAAEAAAEAEEVRRVGS